MRISTVETEAMTPEQKRTAEEAVSGKRGRMPAPLQAWVHSPEFGARAQKLGEFLRYDTRLDPALSELAVLVTARHWTSHYEWFVHKCEALKAGLDPAVIEAIAERREPVFADRGNIWVKISGIDRLSVEGPPYRDALAVPAMLARHAPERVVWGTDWPHVNLRGPMPDDGELVDLLAEALPDERLRNRILVESPAKLFGFPLQDSNTARLRYSSHP